MFLELCLHNDIWKGLNVFLMKTKVTKGICQYKGETWEHCADLLVCYAVSRHWLAAL